MTSTDMTTGSEQGGFDADAHNAEQPHNAEQHRPGDVVHVEEMTARRLPGVSIRAKAWRVLYRSTTVSGEPTIVSGAVLVPPTSYPGPGPRPLIGFGPGTQGLARSAAVSRLLRWGLEYEALFISKALALGWAVAVTDYPGLGTAGIHPYVVGRANGVALLDVVRAARTLPEAGLDPQGPVGIYGYSEGGSTAGWAAQLQPTYAPELRVVGAAVGSAPADLIDMRPDVARSPFSFLLVYTGIGFNAAYPELGLDSYLTRLGRVVNTMMRRTHALVGVVLGLLLRVLRLGDHRRYTTVDVMALPDWQARMAENSLGFLAPASPVLIGHGRTDQVVPYRQSEALAERWRALGVDIEYHAFPRSEHLGAIIHFWRAGSRFLAEQFRRDAEGASSH